MLSPTADCTTEVWSKMHLFLILLFFKYNTIWHMRIVFCSAFCCLRTLSKQM